MERYMAAADLWV